MFGQDHTGNFELKKKQGLLMDRFDHDAIIHTV